MSYEGFEQHICEGGHYFVIDANDARHYRCEEIICPFCNGVTVFCNRVDDTNCDQYGLIPNEFLSQLIIEEAELETCPCCGHTKELAPERYRPPTKEELEQMRHRLEDGVLVPLKEKKR